MFDRQYIKATVPASGQQRWFFALIDADPNMKRLLREKRIRDAGGNPRDTIDPNTLLVDLLRLIPGWRKSNDGRVYVFELEPGQAVPQLPGLEVFPDAEAARANLDADPNFQTDP